MRDLISEGTSGQFTARGGQIDFEFFCKLMRKKVRDDDTEAELKDAFRVLDKVGQGWIGVDEMRRICKARAVLHVLALQSHSLAERRVLTGASVSPPTER